MAIMSEAMLSGFTTAAAVHVFSSQVKHVLGVSVPGSTGILKLVKVPKLPFISGVPHTTSKGKSRSFAVLY